MITTVTTVVTTVTTVTTITALGLTAAITSAAVVTLMLFLASQEFASAANSRFSQRMVRFAGVGILPLIMAFAVIVVVKIVEAL